MTNPYLASVFGLSAIGSASIVAIVVFRPGDNTGPITILIGFLGTILASLISILRGNVTSAEVIKQGIDVKDAKSLAQETKKEMTAAKDEIISIKDAVNGRTDRLVAKLETAASALVETKAEVHETKAMLKQAVATIADTAAAEKKGPPC